MDIARSRRSALYMPEGNTRARGVSGSRTLAL